MPNNNSVEERLNNLSPFDSFVDGEHKDKIINAIIKEIDKAYNKGYKDGFGKDCENGAIDKARAEEREKVSSWFSKDIECCFVPKCGCGEIATKQTAKGKHAQEKNHRPANWGYFCEKCYAKGLKIEEEAMYGCGGEI